MPNTIELAQTFVPMLDEVYKLACLTSVLDGAPELAKQGANANELIIPKMSMQGLADYSRNSGYVDGDVTLTNETVVCNFDRGRMFTVDTMDNLETAGIAFGRLAGEFIRTKVVPELDAFRFASYAGITGISKVAAGATLADGTAVVAALRAASTKMDEDEVPFEERYLFITPTLRGMVEDMDTTKSREVLNRFASVTNVPQTRLNAANGKLEGFNPRSPWGERPSIMGINTSDAMISILAPRGGSDSKDAQNVFVIFVRKVQFGEFPPICFCFTYLSCFPFQKSP